MYKGRAIPFDYKRHYFHFLKTKLLLLLLTLLFETQFEILDSLIALIRDVQLSGSTKQSRLSLSNLSLHPTALLILLMIFYDLFG